MVLLLPRPRASKLGERPSGARSHRSESTVREDGPFRNEADPLRSVLQLESYEVVQQNESAAQIEVAQLLQPDVSAAPVLHSRCEQVGGGGVPQVVLLPKIALGDSERAGGALLA